MARPGWPRTALRAANRPRGLPREAGGAKGSPKGGAAACRRRIPCRPVGGRGGAGRPAARVRRGRASAGPAGTVTPLHCDYDDNIFAQALGSKRVILAPPHHDAFLYPRDANPILAGSPFDPERPDYDRWPLARAAAFVECTVAPGELLYVPAGWYHQVRALTFSLSVNRWARGMPLALRNDPALRAHA